MLVGFVLGTIYGLRCMVLRLHDMRRTGWMSPLMVVQEVTVILAAMRCFVAGDDDANDHDPAPEGVVAPTCGEPSWSSMATC